jgi:ABC-type multidrug transport system fused ATPase/permease subunit
LILVAIVLFGSAVKKASIDKITVLKELGGITEEILSSIKLITSFSNEEKEIEKFVKQANVVRNSTYKHEVLSSSFMGLIRFMIFSFYVYAFWIGTVFIKNEIKNFDGKPYTTGTILTVLMALITGIITVMSLTPNIQAVFRAKVVGKAIYDVIDREPAIRDSEKCLKNFDLNTGIYFNDVVFKYPTALEALKKTFDKASFKIIARESTAIVGPSGSGKSTIV